MNARQEYLADLLDDCITAVEEAQVPTEQQPTVIAALVLSDAINGLRKAMLQTAGRSAGGQP